MDESKNRAVEAERRGGDRVPLSNKVTVRIDAPVFDGEGHNLSDDGLLLLLGGEIPVHVQIEGETMERRGVLVRLATHSVGKLGMAVRFLPPA